MFFVFHLRSICVVTIVIMGKHKRGRSRERNNTKHRRRSRSRSTHSSRSRSVSSNSELRESLQTIIGRLNALEDRSSVAASSNSNVEINATTNDTTSKIVEAIHSLKTSSRDYYVSNFDPNVHNVDLWFDEVDRAQSINNWSDTECLSRIGHCLKGDAKSWLDDWVTTDRSWSNFKKRF